MQVKTYKEFQTLTGLKTPTIQKCLFTLGIDISIQALRDYESGKVKKPQLLVINGLDAIAAACGHKRGTIMKMANDEFSPPENDIARLREILAKNIKKS